MDAEEQVPYEDRGHGGGYGEDLALALGSIALQVGYPDRIHHEGEIGKICAEHDFVEEGRRAEGLRELAGRLEAEDGQIGRLEDIVVRKASECLGGDEYGLGEKEGEEGLGVVGPDEGGEGA